MKTLVLTCPELDGGRRKDRFQTNRFPNVEFVMGMSRNRIQDSLGIAGNAFNRGYGNCAWDAGAIAVAYGHLRTWKRVVETNQLCLILEDDAIPVSKLWFDYSRLPRFVKSCRFSGKWLLSLWRHGIGFYEPFNRKVVKITPSYGNAGAVGYVITPETAQYLIGGFPGIECPVDHFMLGMGFRESPDYSVYVTRRNRIGHANGVSLREDDAF